VEHQSGDVVLYSAVRPSKVAHDASHVVRCNIIEASANVPTAAKSVVDGLIDVKVKDLRPEVGPCCKSVKSQADSRKQADAVPPHGEAKAVPPIGKLVP
jgi:hypothetical protein